MIHDYAPLQVGKASYHTVDGAKYVDSVPNTYILKQNYDGVAIRVPVG